MNSISNLFVIDDDRIYHFLLKNLFKQNGITVKSTFYSNGQDAIDAIRLNNTLEALPDLILLDVNMPIINGWQFLEEYSKIKDGLAKQSSIYMISSSNDEMDINKAKSYGNIVKDYFLKPICKEDLDKIFTVAG
jgi:CheY-like chemotaxis protein